MNQKLTLSHKEAWGLIEGVKAKLELENKGAAVAVVDDYGELLAFLRTDGCKLPSIMIAINKAFTAAREQVPSKTLGQASLSDPFPMTNFGDLRYTAWGGGIPIVFNDSVVGALGVSGLPESEDMILAQEAVTQFLADLE